MSQSYASTGPQGGSSPSCNEPLSPEECCGFMGDVTWFCKALCVLCCMTCKAPPIVFSANCFPNCVGEEIPTPIDDDRPAPIVPSGQGISFTQSSYGLGIPILFGADALPGNVFWSTGFDFRVIRDTTGRTRFYATTTFALGLCEGIVGNLLRLWMGDRLVLDRLIEVDENGIAQPRPDGSIASFTVDLTTPDSPLRNLNDSERATRIVIYSGSPDQLAPPIMRQVEGNEFTPAYRGIAYILFENLVVTESVPDIRAEVTANAVDLVPRVYGELPSDDYTVHAPAGSRPFLGFDASYNVFYTHFTNVGDTESGIVVYDGNTMEILQEFPIRGPDQPILRFNGKTSHVLTNGLLWVDSSGSSGDGTYWTYNPLAGVPIDTIAGGNSGTGTHNGTGPAATDGGSVTFPALSPRGLLRDIIVLPNRASNIGFAILEISEIGQIFYRHFQNGVMGKQRAYCAYYPLDAAVSDNPATAAFPDGGPTYGQHVYAFGCGNNETVDIAVVRISVSEPASIVDPVYTTLTPILYADLGIDGVAHEIYNVFKCHYDNTIIVLMTPANTSRPNVIFKYDPLSESIVWRNGFNGLLTTTRAADTVNAIIYGRDYSILTRGTNSRVITVDLEDGGITDSIVNLPLQSLEAPFARYTPVFNGLENTITYATAEPGKTLTKIFINRANRSQALVSTIVTNLLDRVGYSIYGVIVDDLQLLSVDGYRIDNPTQLRSVFSELKQVFRFDIVESNGLLLYKTRGALPNYTIREEDARSGEADQSWLTLTNEYDFANTRRLNIAYRDPARDYRENVQTIQLSKYVNSPLDNDSAIDVKVPIVLDATSARRLAEILLYSKLVYETTLEFSLPPRERIIDPGDVLLLEFSGTTPDMTVRVQQANIGQDRSVELVVSREDPDIYRDQISLFGNVGRYAGVTLPELPRRVDPFYFEFPARTEAEVIQNDTLLGFYPLYATLLIPRQSGAVPNITFRAKVGDNDPVSIPRLARFATWGYVVEPPTRTAAYYGTDEVSTVVVRLVSASGPAVIDAPDFETFRDTATCNLAYMGKELVRFKDVVDLGENTYALSYLLRAQNGTEDGVRAHYAGEIFIMLGDSAGILDNDSFRGAYIPQTPSPFQVIQTAITPQSNFVTGVPVFYNFRQFQPRAPANFQAVYVGDDVLLSWAYTGRHSNAWNNSGADVLTLTDGLTTAYTLYLTSDRDLFNPNDPTTYMRKVEQEEETFLYTDAMQTVDSFDRDSDTLYAVVLHSGSLTGQEFGQPSVFTLGPKPY